MTAPSDPIQWRQFLLIDNHSIHYLLHRPGDQPLTGVIDVTGTEEEGLLKAFESTVYNNPFLLDDYASTVIVTRAEAFSLLPNDYADHLDEAVRAHKASRVANDNDVVVAQYGSLTAAWEMERGLNNFLQRTFNSPRTMLHLLTLAEYCTAMSRSATGSRVYLNFHGSDVLDIIVNDSQGELLMANSVSLRDTSDAAYFALNVWRQTAVDDTQAEMHLTGDNVMRAAVAPLLSKYVATVKQAAMPAAITALGDIPLELAACVFFATTPATP